MTVPTNRNKTPSQDPEMAAIINSNDPIVEEIKVEDTPQNPVVEPQKEDTEPDNTPESPSEPIVEPQKIPAEPQNPTNEPKSPITPKEPDYKEKFKASSQEALVLHFKNQKLQETIDEAANLPEPTEQEIRDYAAANGENYDELSDLTKQVLKDSLANKRYREKINEASRESKNMTEWVGKVDHFISTPEVINKYPDLLDNADEFRSFAIKQSRVGVDLDDLVTSFLYGLSQVTPTKNKGSVLLPSGGGGAAPKVDGITDDQAKMLRESNPKEYKRLIKAGKIKIEI